MDEQVAIVDTKGNVLYAISKKIAHEKGLLHQTVIAEVISTNDKWLMVKQSADRQDPGQYVSPVGGHVKAGESCDDALKREAFEELGLNNFQYKQIGNVIFNRKVLGRMENHMFVVYEIYSDKKPMLNEEGESCKWFTREELKKQIKDDPKRFGAAFFPIIDSFYPDLKI